MHSSVMQCYRRLGFPVVLRMSPGEDLVHGMPAIAMGDYYRGQSSDIVKPLIGANDVILLMYRQSIKQSTAFLYKEL
jgi:hypothetical protein